jgi:hypothetical protein
MRSSAVTRMATAASETFIFIPGMAGVGRFRFYSNHHRSNDVYLLNVFSTPNSNIHWPPHGSLTSEEYDQSDFEGGD